MKQFYETFLEEKGGLLILAAPEAAWAIYLFLSLSLRTH